MEKRTVEILGDSKEVLSIKLEHIINAIPANNNILWSIQNIEAIGNENFKGSIANFEAEVKLSKHGLILNSSKLIELANSFLQIIDLTIVGDMNIENLKRYEFIENAYVSCEYVFELIDSSYWIINAELETIKALKTKLKGVNII